MHGQNSRPLNEVVLLFPTPKASDLPDALHRRNSHGSYYLPGVVVRMRGEEIPPPKRFPTPTAADGRGGIGTSPKREGGENLRTAVTRLPSGGGTTSPPSDDGST